MNECAVTPKALMANPLADWRTVATLAVTLPSSATAAKSFKCRTSRGDTHLMRIAHALHENKQ